MYITSKRRRVPPVIIFLLLGAFFVAGCTQLPNENWPGLTAVGDTVYVAFGQGVLAVDVEAREERWFFPDEPNAALTFFAAPSVRDERVVFGDYGQSGGFFNPNTTVSIYAFEEEAETLLEPLWVRTDIAEDRIVAPAAQSADTIFIGTADNHLLALDAESGDLQWEFETEHSIWAQPIYHEGILYVASLDNNVYALDVETQDLLWEASLSGSVASGPTLSGQLLYVPSFDRQMHALDIATGEERWAADAGDWVWGSPTIGGGLVYYGDISGNLFAVDAVTGELSWHRVLEGAIQSAPLFVDGRLFVGTGEIEGDEEARTGQLIALDAANGDILWEQEAPAPVFSAPVATDENIVVALRTAEGLLQLLVYDQDSGALEWDFTPVIEE
ncbi:MAG: PQQ-binding-like beta-propeller repeat protein [Candidatus Promineifilaceae bacterium]|nr:PQQ-binding-like beta-propeller repeat protein [Candidatus Promineifilaceae bacterium]